MATSLKVASLAFLCDQHYETVDKLETVTSAMAEALMSAAEILQNVTKADELKETIEHISIAEEATVSAAAYSMLRIMQGLSKELKKMSAGFEEVSATIRTSQEITGQELGQIKKLDDEVLDKVVAQKKLRGEKITSDEAKKALRETIGSVRCWMTGIRQHELGRLHMLRTTFDQTSRSVFGSASRLMRDSRRLFKACNDIDPELDVDLSLNWAGTTHSRNLADDDEQDEKKDAGDDDLTDDPLFNWFVDTDNDGGGNPAASPSSSAYKSASPSPPPPPPPPRPREIDSDADSDSDDDGRPRKMVLEQYFIGSPEKDADKSNPPNPDRASIPPPPPLPSPSQIASRPKLHTTSSSTPAASASAPTAGSTANLTPKWQNISYGGGSDSGGGTQKSWPAPPPRSLSGGSAPRPQSRAAMPGPRVVDLRHRTRLPSPPAMPQPPDIATQVPQPPEIGKSQSSTTADTSIPSPVQEGEDPSNLKKSVQFATQEFSHQKL